MMIFDEKVGERGWLNADVIKKYTRKKLCLCAQKKSWNFLKKNFCAMPT